MNHLMWQYGAWIASQARLHDLRVLDPQPFATLTDRVRAILMGG